MRKKKFSLVVHYNEEFKGMLGHLNIKISFSKNKLTKVILEKLAEAKVLILYKIKFATT